MLVGEFCNREVVIAHKDSTLIEIAKLMRQHHVGDIVLIDEDGIRKPVGIVTDRDLVVEIIAQEVPVEDCIVGDIMSFDLVTASETDGIWETLQKMRTSGIRRLPVIDTEGSLVGIVTADDLLELLSEELSDLVKLIFKEQSREQKLRG